MSATLFAEAGVGRGHHADEPFAIGAQGLHLDVGPQFEVAASDARDMKVGVHASETLDESVEVFRGIVACDIQRFDLDLFGGFGPQGFEGFQPTPGSPQAPPFADAGSGGREPYARGGSDDDDAFHLTLRFSGFFGGSVRPPAGFAHRG